jgi:hypothetical protein
MLQELQTLALVGLLVSTYYLTVGCKNLGESMPLESSNISGKVEGMTEVLNDISTLLDEALDSFAGVTTNQNAPMPSSPIEMLLASFMSKINQPAQHGNPQEPEDWEVLPPNDTQTKEQTEIIP